MSDLRADSSLFSLPTRRSFLQGAGAAMLAPGGAWARTGRVSPSDRITLGVIGWGMMGPSNTKAFLQQSDCQVVAACDLHKDHLQSAVDTINNRYENKDCKAYQDYREMLARDDIDAVMIAVPDHWHALIATAAAARKKDIYGEKPLARTSRNSRPSSRLFNGMASSGRPAPGNAPFPRFIKQRRLSATV